MGTSSSACSRNSISLKYPPGCKSSHEFNKEGCTRIPVTSGTGRHWEHVKNPLHRILGITRPMNCAHGINVVMNMVLKGMLLLKMTLRMMNIILGNL